MKILNYILFVFILLSFQFNYIFAETYSSPQCVYKFSLKNVDFSIYSDESQGIFWLGEPTSYNSVVDGCSDYDLSRMGYMLGTECMATFNGGYKIYNNMNLINYFEKTFPTFDRSRLVPYNPETCSGDTGSNLLVNIDPNVDSSSSYESSTIGNVDENINQFFNDTLIVDERRSVCSQSGGIFGIFSNENSCEAISMDNISCIFNPYLGGLFSSKLNYFGDNEIISYDEFESSCIPSIEFRSCYDYKSKINCIEDINNLNCKWIESNIFSPIDSFKYENGICISNTSSGKFYNLENYYLRGNYIQNPSFENKINNWIVHNNYSVIKDHTVNGNCYLKLDSDSSIVQKIKNIKSGILYLPSLYILSEDFSNESYIELELKSDVENEISKIYLKDIYLENSEGYFKRINFDFFSSEEDLEELILNITFKGNKDEFIKIDAVSFEPTQKDGISITDYIFKPVEILSSSISNCNLCFDKSNLNYCSKKKSDLLGDCSYLVQNSSDNYESNLGENYLGFNSNIYMYNRNLSKLDWDKTWEFQSISNDKLFCELYINKNQCEDMNNYVNSKFSILHPYLNSSLCKWDEDYGCFKDSNGDGNPDTRNLIPLLRASSDLVKESFKYISSYNKFPINGNKYSDFDLSCDVEPPSYYIYFTAINSSSNKFVIRNEEMELVGNANIHIFANDPIMNSCVDFDIENRLYVDYLINNKYAGYRYVNSNQLSDVLLVQDYFRNSTSSLIKDGINNISIIIKDQSGNFGPEFKFKINLDVSGPNIDLINYDTFPLDEQFWLISDYIGNNSVLSFNITDYSGVVDSCYYNLIPNSENINPDFYISYGEFNLTNLSENNNIYNFSLPIYNSSINGDLYTLEIVCKDPFNQESKNSYSLNVDYSTEIILAKPLSFRNKLSNNGILNNSFEINFISTDKKLDKCNLSFNSGEFINLSILDRLDGFNFENYPEVTFYKNISGFINFNKSGVKNGTITCMDSLNNLISKNFTYIYDSIKPKLHNYSLKGTEIEGVKSVIVVKNKSYTWNKENIIFRVNINSTGSFLDTNSINLTFLGDISFGNINPIYQNFNISDSINDLDSFEINSFTNFMDLGYYGSNIENNLYYLNYSISFRDLAGNSGNGIIGMYYDNSKPEFRFSGDIGGQTKDNIYTGNSNPVLNISFNTPSYRLFKCDIELDDGNYKFKHSFDYSNNISFSLNDILGYGVDLSKDIKYKISLDCFDEYGIELKGLYNIKYDITPPVLNRIYLNNGNSKFFINHENAVYNDLLDNIVFDLDNTNEDYYNCSYVIMNISNYYSCNSSLNSNIFLPDELKMTEELNILGGRGILEHILTPICLRTDNLEESQHIYSLNEENLETSILIRGQCRDPVGLETNISTLEVPISYIVGGKLIDFTLSYTDTEVIPKVRSMVQVSKILISFDSTGLNPLLELNSYKSIDGIFEYSSNSGFDINLIGDESKILWAVAVDDNGNIIDTKYLSIYRDLNSPLVYLDIVDADENNYVYSENFEIKFNAIDLETGISSVRVLLDGQEIFSAKSKENISFNNNFFESPDYALNYFSANNARFDGDLLFKGGILNKTYSFILEVTDYNGNTNYSIKTITIKDGIGIILLNVEDNSYVDLSKMYWVTNLKKPIISFKTSKFANYCVIYPFYDDQWSIILGEDVSSIPLQVQNSGDNIFTYDLSSLNNFDLSLFPSSFTPIKIICSNGSNIYNYTRNIRYINSLPDYVLSSSEGFILNEEPYSSNIIVKSVGPFRDISCEYSLDDGSNNNFIQGVSREFSQEISFIDKSTGVHKLKLRCKDILGTYGPEKEYNFIVNKSNKLRISNLEIYDHSDFKFLPVNNNDYYIGDNDNVNIRFNLNMKNGVSCRYIVNPTGDFISNIISYFRRLFNLEEKDITQLDSNPFEFRIENINLPYDNNVLEIDCSNTVDSISMEFNLIKSNINYELKSEFS